MADMAKSATCLPNYLGFIQDGGRGNYEEAEGLVFENR